MNLKNRLKNILDNKRYVILVVIACVLVIAITTIASLSSKKKNDALKKELAAFEKDYLSYCDIYDNAVKKYNTNAEKINNFIADVDEFNVFSEVHNIELRSEINRNFDEYRKSNDDISVISNDVKKINTETKKLEESYLPICETAYDTIVNNYNDLVNDYNSLKEKTSLDFIKDIPEYKTINDSELFVFDETSFTEEKLIDEISKISDDINDVSQLYIVSEQITAPSKDFIYERLNDVGSITSTKAVTQYYDPNMLLGKENGGYTSCVYFTVDNIAVSDVKGVDAAHKGVDGGGSVEVYATLDDALKRCDYLSQFDGTILYSGSYTIVGTMVIRTSYKLSNEEQIQLTDDIINSLTEIKE